MGRNEDTEGVIAEFPFQNDVEESGETHACDICEQEFETKRGRNIHRGQAHRSE